MPAPTLVVGAPCWIDIYSSDTAKATEFYGQLFGWTAEPPEEGFGGYFTFTKDGKHVGGCMHNDGAQGVPDAWTVYLRTDDIEATAEAAAAHGGRVDLAPMAVADNGSMAMVADPGQASVGVWQPGTQQGFEVRDEIGTPNWFELLTRDYDASVDFYRDVFKWDTHTQATRPSSATRRSAKKGISSPGSWTRSAFLPDGRAGPVVGLLRRRGHRCGAAEGRRARREGHPADRGHPVRPPGAGRRPDGDAVQARLRRLRSSGRDGNPARAGSRRVRLVSVPADHRASACSHLSRPTDACRELFDERRVSWSNARSTPGRGRTSTASHRRSR